MAEKRVNELLKTFRNNSQVKSITNFIQGNNKTRYYKYPKIKNNELVNNFIGTYCPMGYYKVNKRGNLKIVPDRPILSQTKQMDNNLKNFSCYNKSCESNSSNTSFVEGFNNYVNRNEISIKITNLIIILFFLSIIFIIFYRN